MERFRAMGCEVVVGGATAAELEEIRELFDARERTFSRFCPGSELSRVNAAPGDVVVVSPVFRRMLDQALRAAALTDGLVDPTLGAAIEAAGYDRDIAELVADPRPPGEAARWSWRSLSVVGPFLRRPSGLRLDLNGVVKGRTVDDALALLAGPGFVSAGGDLATTEPLDVELPALAAVRVRGALATSSATKRRWLRGGEWQHHLIDPRSGRPSRSPWTDVTVCAGTCVEADVAAKAAFLLGWQGPAWLDRRTLAGRFLLPSGEAVHTRAWLAGVPAVDAA
ncbi:MAG TPA: FAD:protein FMN transferase [Gaiellaceae bacterium]|nr:FAD:protein FMN transferase [Gaiellaceae bacterium]